MRSKQAQKLKIQAVQKEQVQLVQIESILTSILGKVNESINELKVEELQIKSNLVEQYTQDDLPTTSAHAASRFNATYLQTDADPLNIQQPNATIDMEGIEDINKQMLALESLLVPLQRKNYKEEEEEDDDDYDEEDDEYMPTDDDD